MNFEVTPRRIVRPRFFLKPLWKASIEIILLLLLLFNLPMTSMLVLIEGGTGNELLSIPIKPEDQFSIQYIHSIHRTPVLEFFHVDSNYNIVVDKTIFDTYGVGIPSDLSNGEEFAIENGKFVLNHLNRVLPSMDLRIGQVISNHEFIINDKKIRLATLTKPGNWIRFQVKRQSLLQSF